MDGTNGKWLARWATQQVLEELVNLHMSTPRCIVQKLKARWPNRSGRWIATSETKRWLPLTPIAQFFFFFYEGCTSCVMEMELEERARRAYC